MVSLFVMQPLALNVSYSVLLLTDVQHCFLVKLSANSSEYYAVYLDVWFYVELLDYCHVPKCCGPRCLYTNHH